jgi:hypothetical protein
MNDTLEIIILFAVMALSFVLIWSIFFARLKLIVKLAILEVISEVMTEVSVQMKDKEEEDTDFEVETPDTQVGL